MTVITTQLASINISFDREKKCNMRCVSQHTHYEYKFLFKMSLSVSKATKGNTGEIENRKKRSNYFRNCRTDFK